MAKPKVVPLEWSRPSDIIALFVLTGILLEEEPQSLLLVGQPSVGKSALLRRFSNVKWLAPVFDMTMSAMYDVVFPSMRDSKQTHLVMTEFHKMYDRQKATAENAINTLSSAMSGDLGKSFVGPNKWIGFEDFRIGVLGAMTTANYGRWASKMKDSGLLSRFSVYTVRMSPEMLQEQRRAAMWQDGYMLGPYDFRRIDISSSDKREIGMSALMMRAANEVAETVPAGAITARSSQMVRALMKASALLRGSRHVEQKDVETVRAVIFTLYDLGEAHGKR